MMWNEKNIFELSGCLTRKAFSALLAGELHGLAKTAADAHVAGCPFCADALEGFEKGMVSFNQLLDNVDKDFEENYAVAKANGRGRKIWISAIAAAASILLLVWLFQMNKNVLHTELVALKAEKETDSTQQVNKPAAQPNNQIALNSEPVRKENKGYPLRRQKPNVDEVEKAVTSTELVFTEDLEKPAVPSASEMKVAAPVSTDSYDLAMADSLTILKDDAKASGNLGYIAYAEEKQMEGVQSKKSRAAKSKDAKQEAPAAEYKIASDEQPLFQYKEFTDFGKYIESLFPAIADSSSVAKAYIEVVIDEKGKVADARMLKGINAAIDKDILKKVKNSPVWIPGKKAGEPVKGKVYFMLNIGNN